MASIAFQVSGKTNPSKITLRLTVGKNEDYGLIIPIVINPAYFNWIESRTLHLGNTYNCLEKKPFKLCLSE